MSQNSLENRKSAKSFKPLSLILPQSTVDFRSNFDVKFPKRPKNDDFSPYSREIDPSKIEQSVATEDPMTLHKLYVSVMLSLSILLGSSIHVEATTLELTIRVGSWFNKKHQLTFDGISKNYKYNFVTSDSYTQCYRFCDDDEYMEYATIFESTTIRATVSEDLRNVTYYWQFYNVWSDNWDSEDGTEYIDIDTARNRYRNGASTGGWYDYERDIKASTQISLRRAGGTPTAAVPLPLTGALLVSSLAALGIVGQQRRQRRAATGDPVTGR